MRANRLTSVTDWNSHATAYAYDDAGRMTTATLPSGTGIVSTYSYDNADRLTGVSHVKGGSTTVASVSYTLDDVGNRTQRVDQAGTHSYSYDDLYRLTSVTYPGPATTSYAFDAFGNRTSMTVGSATTSYSYDDADRLTAVTPPSPASAINYTWDDNGDLTARGSDSFSWDYEDRMVSATVNSVTTTFAYRGDGLRDSRTVGGNTTTFTWDVASGLPVVLDDGNQYLYGAGLVAQKQSGSWYYYLSDGLGSTMAIVDGSGNVQNSYAYDVYGTPTKTGSLTNEFDFAGQQTDGSTGLQYLRARYYDPATGTFAAREPLASMPKWTGGKFGYAGANPTTNVDPTGLYSGESKVNKAVAFTKKWVAPALGECAAWGASSALAGVALGGTPTGVVVGAAAGCLAGALSFVLDAADVNNPALTCAVWAASGFAQPAKFLLLRGISAAADCAAALLNREYPSKGGANECGEWGAAGLLPGLVTRGAGGAERTVATFAGCAGGFLGNRISAQGTSP